MPIFRTKAEAVAAGYVPTHDRVDLPGGARLISIDVSEYPTYGYDWALIATPPAALRDIAGIASPEFAASRSVTLSAERNAAGQVGCFLPMYTPEDYRQACEDARAWVAEVSRQHAALVAAYEAWIDARARRDHLKRSLRLARKGGAAPELVAALDAAKTSARDAAEAYSALRARVVSPD